MSKYYKLAKYVFIKKFQTGKLSNSLRIRWPPSQHLTLYVASVQYRVEKIGGYNFKNLVIWIDEIQVKLNSVQWMMSEIKCKIFYFYSLEVLFQCKQSVMARRQTTILVGPLLLSYKNNL